MIAGQREFVEMPTFGERTPGGVAPSDWRQALTGPATRLRDLVPIIRAHGVAIVVDRERKLIGTVSDRDVRRALLDGACLDEPAGSILRESCSSPAAGDPMPRPLLDDRQRVLGIQAGVAPRLDQYLVVVMAGGLGRRLRPLTRQCPKPLIPIGGRPLLELTVEALRGHGFRRVMLCVGYGADRIERHFGDGRRFGVTIEYVHDRDLLGTAGPLTLLPRRPSTPLLVMNGDIVTSTDFARLMAYHDAAAADATMCVCDVALQGPYGVVAVHAGRLEGVLEKPVQRCRVNAGIYVLGPHLLESVPRGRSVNMPEFLESVIQRGGRVEAFPIHEQWIDVGSPADLALARAALKDNRSGRRGRRPALTAGTRPVAADGRTRVR